MDEYIIMPDDDTMARLADEYGKIKAKTFSGGHADGEKAGALACPIQIKTFNCAEVCAELCAVSELFGEAAILTRRLARLLPDGAAKNAIEGVREKKREAVGFFAKLASDGKITVASAYPPDAQSKNAIARALVENSLKTDALLRELAAVAQNTSSEQAFEKLIADEQHAALLLLLALT